MSYLTEAFKQLNIIDEDLFPTDSEGLNKLKDFMKSDIEDDSVCVYDDTATNEEELKDSYEGKVILRCNVCKSYFFKDPTNVVISEEDSLANVGDECCYCHNDMGYNVVGVVAPFVKTKEVEADDKDIRAEEVHNVVDRSVPAAETEGECKTDLGIDKALKEETLYDKVKKYFSDDKIECLDSINEDLKEVQVTTDDTKLNMTADETGKVTVTSEPICDKAECVEKEEDAEVVKPLSAEDKDLIADNVPEEGGENVLDDGALDFDEINDEDLDDLSEKYFTSVYDNVESYKSTACKLDESAVILEGVIKFKSGKEAKTRFNFNEAYATKTGKVKLIGENAQFAKSKSAFTLTGAIKDKKLVVESFTYNYRTKDEKTGKSTKLYGTINK